MKNIRKYTTYILLATLGTSALSCTKDFAEINTDPIGKGTVTPNQLLAPAMVNVLNANMVRNRNFNNELMQVTVDIGDDQGKVFRYDFRRTLADYLWNSWYLEVTNFKDMFTIASQAGKENKSYQGIALIAQAWTFQLLTDTYGDVPYTEAGLGKVGTLEPKFDLQKDIYLDLFQKLEQANTLLKENAAIISTGDPVFQGDVSKWRRLGNSLYLRLLLRISRKADVSAQAIAKIKEIGETNRANYPIMETNEHTAKILWNGTNSSTAVYSSPFMINVRAVDFRSPAITDFFIGPLVSTNDPRRARWGIAQGPNGFVGVPSGYAQGTGVTKQAYFYSDAQSQPITLQTDRFTGIIMNVAEVDFILAEAAARGFITGTGESYYLKGMADAINYWLPGTMTSVTGADFIKYVTEADLQWDNALPLDNQTAGSNSKLEMIHIQKYYANFLVDLQQWFEFRRTGHPQLPKGPGLANGGVMPARFNYPAVTQSTNPTAYKNAVAVQGPDEISTQVWWQKP